MGLSSSKTTTGPSKAAMPYLTQASGALQGAYDRNQPNLDAISSGLSSAFSRFSDNYGNDPTLGAARGYINDTLGSDPAQNPFLDNIINSSNSDIMDRINAIFSKSGQTGSTRQLGELGKQLSNNEYGLRYQDYNAGQDRKAQAVQQALSLGGLDNQTALALAGLGDAAARTPYLGAEMLASGLGGLWGNSQTTKQSGGLGQALLGAGAQLGGAAILASDRRLKYDIVKIGEFSDHLGAYEFSYIYPPSASVAAMMPEGGDTRFVGVMADEVALYRPWALGPVVDGYMTVNYGAL